MNSSNTDWHEGGYDNGNESDALYGGDEDLKDWANHRGVFLFWVAAISVAIAVMIFLLWTMGNVQFGRQNISYYSATSNGGGKAHFGNNPNWRMGFGDAGLGSSVDIPGTDNSLGFNTEYNCPIHGNTTSKFTDHMNPLAGVGKRSQFIDRMNVVSNKKDHLDNNDAAAAATAAAAARAERDARQKMFEDQSMKTCADPWDPMATEEAQVLASVGTYARPTGLGSFNRTVNPNCTATLTDAQLEAIMQGQDSFSVDHLSGNLHSGNIAGHDMLSRQHNTQYGNSLAMPFK